MDQYNSPIEQALVIVEGLHVAVFNVYIPESISVHRKMMVYLQPGTWQAITLIWNTDGDLIKQTHY
jgi:hypothetical protein